MIISRYAEKAGVSRMFSPSSSSMGSSSGGSTCSTLRKGQQAVGASAPGFPGLPRAASTSTASPTSPQAAASASGASTPSSHRSAEERDAWARSRVPPLSSSSRQELEREQLQQRATSLLTSQARQFFLVNAEGGKEKIEGRRNNVLEAVLGG